MFSFFHLRVVHIYCLFLLLSLCPGTMYPQDSIGEEDSFTQQQFITGCAKYRERVIHEIEQVLNSLVLLSNSLASTSFNPDAHYRFSELIVKGTLPENHEMSIVPVTNTMAKIFAEDQFASNIYHEWIEDNRFGLMELGFLVSIGFLEEKAPYKLTTLQALWQEFSFYGFREDMVIADIGAGNGFLSFILLESGLKSKIVMTEVDKDFLTLLETKQDKYHIDYEESQIQLVKGSKTSLGLGDQKVDCIILREVFHHLQDPYAILQDCKKHLNAGGYIVLREATKDLIEKQSERCSKATTYQKITSTMDKAGYTLLQESIIDESYMLRYSPRD